MPHESTAPKTKMIHTMERFPSFLLFATAPCSIRLKSPTRLPALIIFQILSVLRRSGWLSLLHNRCGRKTRGWGGEQDNLTVFAELVHHPEPRLQIHYRRGISHALAHVLEPARDVEKLGEELLGKDVVEHLHRGSFYADETSHFTPFSDMRADAICFPIMPYCSTSRSAPDTRLRHSPLPHRTALPEFNG